MKTLKALFVALAIASSSAAVAQDYVSTPVTVSSDKVRLSGKVYYSHVVLERQTLFSIAKAYGVTVEDIYAANPNLEKTGLQKNSIILVPSVEKAPETPSQKPEPAQQQAPQEPQAATSDGPYIEHTAKWFETIDDIAKAYGISTRELMAFNGLKSKKLSKRQVLRIPVSAEDAPSEGQIPVETMPADTLVSEAPLVAEAVEDFTARGSIAAHLILPFNADATPANSAMDFYGGALLALKDLKEKEGIIVNLTVHDVISGMPSELTLSGSDFVLGPFSATHLKTLAESTGGRITLVSPLDGRASYLGESVKNFIQVPTSSEIQYSDLADWVCEELGPSDIIVLIREKGAKNPAPANVIRERLDKRDKSFTIVEYAIVEGRGIPNILTEKLIKEGTNRIIVASESEAFVADAMRNISIMQSKKFPIVAYAPSKLRSFDTIDTQIYHNASLRLSTAYFVDYEDAQVKDFVRRFRALYNMEPSRYAYQGYDTMMYLGRLSAIYGVDWKKKLESSPSSGLHTDFKFMSKDGSFYNSAVRRVVYDSDDTTHLVK
ncbi:MAG: LysM peptidoglycan-binding domain-containing protein [Bacteroidales bacterium]|nr:LysM peptidoglycan-binding domain-containing protein [Bacteroidales bacterium]